MRYYEIPASTFNGLVSESGILLKNFDIEAASADTSEKGFTNTDIICATTGGVNATLTPTYSDMGEDVDNCPLNMKELKHLDSWEAKFNTTGLGVTEQNIKDMLGAADATDGKVTPRMSLKQSDFQSIWFVADKANGGFVAAKLDNALATGGFSFQTGKNTKGQTTLEFTGHVSINAQSKVPMTFYSIDPAEEVTYTVTQTLTHVTSDYTDATVPAGTAFTAKLTGDIGYTIKSVSVMIGSEDITESAWTPDRSGTSFLNKGTVSIPLATDNITITAEAE